MAGNGREENRQVPKESQHDKNQVRGATSTFHKFDICNLFAGG